MLDFDHNERGAFLDRTSLSGGHDGSFQWGATLGSVPQLGLPA